MPGVQALLDAVADGRRVAAALGRPVDQDATVLLDLRAAATLSRRADLGAPALLAQQLLTETSAAATVMVISPRSRLRALMRPPSAASSADCRVSREVVMRLGC